MSADQCTHLDQVRYLAPEGDVSGCAECLRTGGTWVHLRMCHTCGEIGCCDSSPSKHASQHATAARHPIARSVEAGEHWSWCYADQVMMRLDRGA